jgi:sialate O-acetylesterase
MQFSHADDNKKLIVDLKGEWKFSIGKRDEWVSENFNAQSWSKVKVPESWEDQGFHGYNGYAFYRKKITIKNHYKGHLFFLELGYIDDVDQVYFNGKLVGSTGSFPPDYESAYDAKREYYIPENIVTFNEPNVIVVKVYDNVQRGGIVSGKPGLYASKAPLPIDLHLSGYWRFMPGDKASYRNPQYNDNDWSSILVPSKWENQGYRDYDGFGWYRKTFRLKGNIDDDKVVVLLGKIDDIDKAYLNGELIGGTGDFDDREDDEDDDLDFYEALRGYLIEKHLLKKRKNVLAVRVYDWGGYGGIYEGPVGIVSQEKYINYWHKMGNE